MLLARELSMSPADVGRLRPTTAHALVGEVLEQRKARIRQTIDEWSPLLIAAVKGLQGV